MMVLKGVLTKVKNVPQLKAKVCSGKGRGVLSASDMFLKGKTHTWPRCVLLRGRRTPGPGVSS